MGFLGLATIKDLQRLEKKLMAEIDDIKAAQAQTQTLLDGLQAGIDAVQAEVQALIDQINGQTPPDLAAVLAAATAINDRLVAMQADVAGTPQPPTP